MSDNVADNYRKIDSWGRAEGHLMVNNGLSWCLVGVEIALNGPSFAFWRPPECPTEHPTNRKFDVGGRAEGRIMVTRDV